MSRVICDLHRVLKRLPKTSVACITKETFKNTRNDAIQMIKLSQSNHGNTRLVCTCCGLLTNKPALLNKRIYAKRVQLFSSTTILNSKQLTENEYEVIAEETMDSLTELFEDLPEKIICDSEYDTQYGSGVLTVKISDNWGTYVINKQTPNKQIWLSSPISGPKRYDYENGTWVYKHDKRTLHQLLSEEISQALDKNIDFTNCSYGSVEDS